MPRNRARPRRIGPAPRRGQPRRAGKPIVAEAALDAQLWGEARRHLGNELAREPPSRRLYLLMARLEEGEHGDAGRVREWLGAPSSQ